MCAFTERGRASVVAACADGTLYVWDLETANLLPKLQRHLGAADCAAPCRKRPQTPLRWCCISCHRAFRGTPQELPPGSVCSSAARDGSRHSSGFPHGLDAAIFTPRPASSPWILRYPRSVFYRASRRTRALMLRRVAGLAGLAADGPGGPAAADDVAVPAHDRVRGYQQPQPVVAHLLYHGEQGRVQRPVRPVQIRATRLPPLQDGEVWWRRSRIFAIFHVSSR